jgi:dihydropyrimidinase
MESPLIAVFQEYDSIYDGCEVTGRVKQTYLRGELIVDGGTVVGGPDHGGFVR